MKTNAALSTLILSVPTSARPNMRSLYRIDLGAETARRTKTVDEEGFTAQ